MKAKRAKRDSNNPRVAITARIRRETDKLVKKYTAKNSVTRSELVDIALYDYLTR